MRQKLKHEKLVTIEMAIEKINWYQEDEELIIDGSLFDVESIVYVDGIATIRGLYDHEEKDLEKQLSEATGQGRNSNLNSILAKMLQFFFIENEQFHSHQFASLNNNAPQFRLQNSDKLTSPYITVPTPPPLG
ncbi:MAG: hypothetical protein V4722_19635 [Bacteroidota bacterium]